MSSCAVQFSKKFNEEDNVWVSTCSDNLPMRGICSKCYKELVKEGIIQEGSEFPDWLKELIRLQDKQDQEAMRHPTYSLNEVLGE